MNKDREWFLRNEAIFPLFLRFSLPAITGMMVQALYNIVDRYFVSNMPVNGPAALGGIGVTMPVLFILLGFSMLFGIGAGANISIKMGEGRKDLAEKILANSLMMEVIASVILLAVFSFDTKGLLSIFGATSENISFATDYLRIILVGNLWNSLAFAMTHTVRSEGSPKYSMMSMVIGAVANTILDPIFIYTFNMGVKGAAYATIIAQFLSFVWGSFYYLSGRSMIRVRKENLKIEPKIIATIVSIGVSAFFIQIAGSVVGAIFNNSLKSYGGSLAQGAYAIINSMSTLFFMPIFGMNQGLQPILGYNYGAGNYDRVKKAVFTGIAAATAVSTIGWIIMRFYPQILVYPMTADENLRKITIEGIKRVETLTFVVGFQIISSNFFASIGKAKLSFFLSLSRQVFILIPALLILPRFLGLMGIWTAVPVSDIVASILTLIMLIKQIRELDTLHSGKLIDEA